MDYKRERKSLMLLRKQLYALILINIFKCRNMKLEAKLCYKNTTTLRVYKITKNISKD